MQLTNAREFLRRALPWPLDGRGYINIHWTTPARDGSAKVFWQGRAVQSVDAAIRTIEWAASLPDTRDFYVCMSLQSQAEQRTSKGGRPYLNAIRDGDNAISLKSLFLDVDVKGSGYPDTRTAVTELGNFRRAVGLPAPNLIVKSGSGGFHAHWVLAEPIPKSEWSTLAYQLADAAKKHGLKCDTQCTIDSARVLRFPDTKNFKHDPPGQVEFLTSPGDEYSVDRLRASLAAFTAPAVSAAPALPPRTPLTGVSDLAAGIEVTTAPPVNLDNVSAQCGFIREALATGGAAYSNPLWNLTTLVSLFSEGGRADAHRMARNHPGYVEADTDALFDRKQAERTKKDLGWPSCATIAGSGCTACTSCALLTQGQSPLNYAKPRNTVKPSSDLPAKYLKDANNLIYVQAQDQDGNNTRRLVCEYPMFDPWVQRTPWTLHFSTVIEPGKSDKIEIPYELLAVNEGLHKHVNSLGMLMNGATFKDFKEFLMAWVDTLRKNKTAVASSTPFGWVVTNGVTTGFSFGGKIHSTNGEQPAAAPDAQLQLQYSPTGDLQPWLEASKVITDQKRSGLDLILAASFGAPLMRFTGQEGALFSAYSTESGIGKSTAIKVAQSVWGHPKLGVPQLNDTQNSVMNKLGDIKNLPLFWDELKTEDDIRRFVNVAFQLSSGKGKARLGANSQQRAVGLWETLMVVASNDCLMDYITSQTKTTTAGIMRIMEYTVTPGTTGQGDKTAVGQVISQLKDNYGLAGLAYAKFLGQNIPRVSADILALSQQLDEEASIKTEERFWLAGITAVLQGAIYANELKLTDIDTEALRAFLLKIIRDMRGEQAQQPVDMRKKINVSNVLTQFLKEMQAYHTVYTNRINIGRGKPGASRIQIKNNTSHLKGVCVQIGIEDALLRISSFHLRGWLERHGYPQRVFVDALKHEFGAKPVTGRMASGTEKATGDEYIFQIELAGTPLAELANFDGSKEVEPEEEVA